MRRAVDDARRARCAASCGAGRTRRARRARSSAAIVDADRRRRGAAPAARPPSPPSAAAGTRPAAPSNSGVDRAVRLQHHAQAPVDLAARAGGHAFDDFLLQHEVHVADRRGVLERMEQDRRGQVVGQVADEAESAVVGRRSQRGEVDAAARPPRPASARRATARQPPAAAAGRGRTRSPSARHADRAAETSIAPWPGPISTMRSPGCGSIASTIFSIDAALVQEVLAEVLLRAGGESGGVARGGRFMRARAGRGGRGEPRAGLDRGEQARRIGACRCRRCRARCRGRPRRADRAGRASGSPRCSKPLYLSTGRPWSWYIASTASKPRSFAGRNAVSAGSGPTSRMPSARRRSSTGAITSISSRPRWPSSPACGLSPSTAMRGRGDAEVARAARRRTMRSVRASAPRVIASATARSGRCVVASATRTHVVGQHHHHVAAGLRREQFGGAGVGDAALR